MALGTFTLTGTYTNLDGSPAAGKVVIRSTSSPITDPSGNKVFTGPKTVILDTLGKFSIVLPTTGGGTLPEVFGYRVTADLKHNELPAVEFEPGAAGTTMDMADVTPTVIVPVTPDAVTTASFPGLLEATDADPGSTFRQQQDARLSATFVSPGAARLAGYALPGSRKSGTVRVGSTSVAVAASGHNAFPGLAVRRDGDILIVWRSAPQHDPTPTPGVLKARVYAPNGTPRGAEYTILTDALDLRDPMLTNLPDGRIVAQYFKHDGTATTTAGVFLAVSDDQGDTFTEIGRVPFTWDSLAASSGRMTVAPNGDWLVAAYGRTSATFQHIRLMRSTNEGQTWTGEITVAEGQAESRNYVEPVLGVLPDGQTLMCLIRVSDSSGANPAIYRTTSTDNGLTWAAETSVYGGGGGRPAWTSLASGGIALVFRATGAPYPMMVTTSWDNGLTWPGIAQLGGNPGSQGTYAQPVEVAPGLIATAYALENAAASDSDLYLAYLGDGYGMTPLGDDFSDPEGVMFKGAAEAGKVGGAAADGQLMGWPVITLAPGTADQAGFVFRIPSSWRNFDVDLLWVNTAGGTGDVRFRHDMEQVNAGGTLTSAAGVGETVAVDALYIPKSTRMASDVSRSGEFLRVKPTRLGADAADTFAGNIGVLGVKITRTA